MESAGIRVDLHLLSQNNFSSVCSHQKVLAFYFIWLDGRIFTFPLDYGTDVDGKKDVLMQFKKLDQNGTGQSQILSLQFRVCNKLHDCVIPSQRGGLPPTDIFQEGYKSLPNIWRPDYGIHTKMTEKHVGPTHFIQIPPNFFP